MNEINISDWEHYERHVAALYKTLEEIRTKLNLYVSQPVFRGQREAAWKLETTLERYVKNTPPLHKYYKYSEHHRLLRIVRPYVETVTSRRWEIPERHVPDVFPGPPPGYEFMAYLRHHGFPSPLLDWSLSQYIALFFAFAGTDPNTVDNVAVYHFVELVGGGKVGASHEPRITGLGPSIATDRRHYLQQSQYTICTLGEEDALSYASHEDALASSRYDQDVLVKLIFPASLKIEFLRRLDRMNINDYSLFDNEDALMRTLARRLLGEA